MHVAWGHHDLVVSLIYTMHIQVRVPGAAMPLQRCGRKVSIVRPEQMISQRILQGLS